MTRQDNIRAQLDARLRRSALKLIAVSMAAGCLLGLAVGLTVAWHTIERVTVVPLVPGVEV